MKYKKMKNHISVLLLILLSINIIACKNLKMNTKNETINTQNQITVTGKIINIENGKDGYTALIKDANDIQYHAVISRTNLLKANTSEYIRYEIGDKITVSGTFWKDSNEMIYITVEKLSN